MYHTYHRRSRYVTPKCPIHNIPKLRGDCTKCAEEREVKRQAEIRALPDHVEVISSYTGKPYPWSPSQSGVLYFVMLDKLPRKDEKFDANGQLTGYTQVSLEWGCIGCHSTSLETTRKYWTDKAKKFTGYDWTGVNPRIVKAPCVFDAREHNVVVEPLPIPGEGL